MVRKTIGRSLLANHLLSHCYHLQIRLSGSENSFLGTFLLRLIDYLSINNSFYSETSRGW